MPTRVVSELEGLQHDQDCVRQARQAMRYLESSKTAELVRIGDRPLESSSTAAGSKSKSKLKLRTGGRIGHADDEILEVAVSHSQHEFVGENQVCMVTEDKGLRLKALQEKNLRVLSIGQLVSESRESAQPRDLARVVTPEMLAGVAATASKRGVSK